MERKVGGGEREQYADAEGDEVGEDFGEAEGCGRLFGHFEFQTEMDRIYRVFGA